MAIDSNSAKTTFTVGDFSNIIIKIAWMLNPSVVLQNYRKVSGNLSVVAKKRNLEKHLGVSID